MTKYEIVEVICRWLTAQGEKVDEEERMSRWEASVEQREKSKSFPEKSIRLALFWSIF